MRYDHSKATKPAVVDEWMDYYANRRLAALVVIPLLRTSVTPNQVTFASMICGMVSGVAAALAIPHATVYAGFFVAFSVILDCADGQLARARGGGTMLGRAADGAADTFISLCAHLGLLAFVWRSGLNPWPAVPQLADGWAELVVFATGISMGLHANYFDAQKGRFQRMTGMKSAEYHTPAEVEAAARLAKDRLERMLYWIYLVYCSYQARLEEGRPTPPRWPSNSPQADQARTLLTVNLRAWSFLGPSTHLAVLSACLAWAAFEPAAVWWYTWLVLGLGNVVMLALKIWTAKLDRRLAALGLLQPGPLRRGEGG